MERGVDMRSKEDIKIEMRMIRELKEKTKEEILVKEKWLSYYSKLIGHLQDEMAEHFPEEGEANG
jgi:hypothetical protein